MAISLTARDRRAVFLGGLVLGPLVLWRLILVPFGTELAEVRGGVEVERELLVRERALLASAPVYAVHTEALVAALVTYSPRIFSNGEPEAHVRRIAAVSNVSVQRIERIPPPDAEPVDASTSVRQVRLRLTGESDLEGVLSLLAALGTDDRLLVVERIELSNQRPVDSRAPEILQVEVTVRALAFGSLSSGADVQ
jgi:hypothetical protein